MFVNKIGDDKKIAQLFANLEKIDKIVPTISTPALCKLLLDNDPNATTAPEKPDRRIFDSIVSATLLPEMKGRMVLYYYVVKHVVEVMKLRKGNTDMNGYLPNNPAIWEKITPIECGHIAQALDPGNRKPEVRRVFRHVFDRFIDIVSKKEAFSPAKRWRDIKREALFAVIRSIAKRVEGSRYFDEVDESTVQRFIKSTSKNKVHKIFRIAINEEDGTGGGGLKYSPICKSFDPYIEITRKPNSTGTFVLPLDLPLDFELMNPSALIEGDSILHSVYFTLGVFLPVIKGSRVDHLTLLPSETIKSQADGDGRVIFPDVVLDAEINDLKITATVEIKVFNANHEQCGHVTEEVIILPKGETELIVKDENFRLVVERFFNSGKMTESERDSALRNIPNVEDMFSTIDFPPDMGNKTSNN
ncbi:MAG TPA: hypothetical protein P5096_01740 [Patescibacteria group bacterium]|nr:hypothetical protein [Patescibacteria group bacterium]